MSRSGEIVTPGTGILRRPASFGLMGLDLVFGVWYLAFTIVLIIGGVPFFLLRHRGWTRDRFPLAIRRFIQFYGRMVIRLSRPLVRLRVASRDAAIGVEPCVYVLNHLSFVDVYFCGFLPAFQTVIAIRSWPFRMPIFNVFMRWARYIDVEASSFRDILDQSAQALGSGACLLFFPEGHRSRTGRMQPLHKGAFLIAARNNVPVVPVTIAGTEYLGGYRSKLLSPCRVTLTFHPPVRAEGLDFHSIQAFRRRVEDVYRMSDAGAGSGAGQQGGAR